MTIDDLLSVLLKHKLDTRIIIQVGEDQEEGDLVGIIDIGLSNAGLVIEVGGEY